MSQLLPQEASGNNAHVLWKRLADPIPEFAGGQHRGTVTLVGSEVYYASTQGLLAVFSLKEKTWRALGKVLMNAKRGHQAQLAGDKIYYFGEGLPGVVEYDTVLVEAESIANSPAGRVWMATAFAPWRKEIISFGGYNHQYLRINTTHAFNVESKSWKKLEMRGEPPQPRSSHAAVIYGTKMYVFGGYGRGEQSLSDVWIAELRNYSAPFWSMVRVKGEPPFHRCAMPSVHFLRNRLVVFGVSSLETREKLHIISLAEGRWQIQPSPPGTLSNRGPTVAEEHLALASSTGIIYFTKTGIYALTVE